MYVCIYIYIYIYTYVLLKTGSGDRMVSVLVVDAVEDLLA